MSINRLSSGGVIASYRCHAACKHCIYGCSPNMEPGYITEATARKLCSRLYKLQCRRLHIGGGEPFLNVDALITLIKVIRESGITIDYIETNAAWITGDRVRDRQTLMRVVESGGDCIMVSADPFHVAYIPFWKPAALIRLLRKNGISHFIWQEQYLSLLSRLDPKKTYDSAALEETLGYDVIGRCVEEYDLGFNGRALTLIRPVAKKQRAEALVQNTPCRELSRTGHFHVDPLGRYVPPGCTGMGICIEDIESPLSETAYPVMARLYKGGTASLWAYAKSKGFIENDEGYASDCDLCFQMRKYLITKEPDAHPDLSPPGFYQQDF